MLLKFGDELTVLQELREQIEQEIRSLKSGLLKGTNLFHYFESTGVLTRIYS